MIVLEALLNRLRGTGDVFKIGSFRITGIMLYALYLIIVVSLVTEWYYALAFGVLFVAGESYAWGKWTGYLVDYEDEHSPEYDSKVGKGFPYIHYMANYIVSERIDYKRYCQVALAIRGFFWWFPLYLLFAYIGLISYFEAIIIGILLGIGFPIACYIGRNWRFEYKSKWLLLKRGWENQEIIYGLLQGVALWYVLLKNLV